MHLMFSKVTMRFKLNLLILEIKRMLRLLPQFMAGALALSLITGIFVISASQKLNEKKSYNRAKIALVIPDNDRKAAMMMSVIENADSVKESMNFIRVKDRKNAEELMKSNNADGIIIFPHNVVEDILDGTNTPVTVILPKNSGIESLLAKILIDAGCENLATAQAGIYAVTWEYEHVYKHNITSKLQKDINIEYFDYTLPRQNYFQEQVINSTGELTSEQYFICSGLIFTLILMGISFAKVLCNTNKDFLKLIKLNGVCEYCMYCIQVLSVFIVYMVTCILEGIVYFCASLIFNLPYVKINLLNIMVFVTLIFCISSFIVFIFKIIKSKISAILLLFFIDTAMTFVSGGFIPKVFLPDIIQKCDIYIFNYHLSSFLGSVFLDKINISALGGIVIFVILMNFIIIAGSRAEKIRYFIGKEKK